MPEDEEFAEKIRRKQLERHFSPDKTDDMLFIAQPSSALIGWIGVILGVGLLLWGLLA